jgi:hypothetical protein
LKNLLTGKFFLRFNEIALCCPDGGAEKRVSERKLRLREAPEARKLLFRTTDQPRRLRLWIFLKTIIFPLETQ